MIKKICFICGDLSKCGGTERVSSLIANGLANVFGFKISILSTQLSGHPYFDIDDKIEVHSLQPKPTGLISTIKLIRAHVKLNQYDVVINVDSGLVLSSVPALFGLKVRNICWEHFTFNVNVGTYTRDIARQLAAIFCDDVVTLTNRDADVWKSKTLNLANIMAISNPVPPAIEEREKINNKQLLSVGRLSPQKGFDLLLHAWAMVLNHRTDWKLTIVGEGEEKEHLLNIIGKYNLHKSVTIKPFTNDIASCYNSSALYVMSSRYEGFGMVLLEASAHSLPIVSFDCEMGPREIVTTEVGWLCEPENIEALAHTLLTAFEQFDDVVAYQKYSKSAYKNSKRFNLDAIVSDWVKLLNKER